MTASVVRPLGIGRLLAACAALLWTERQLTSLRRELPKHGLNVSIRHPPRHNGTSLAVLERWLRLRRATCLERCLIVQQWLAARGQPHEILIGVAPPQGKLTAHAWLECEDALGHEVLTRIAPGAIALR